MRYAWPEFLPDGRSVLFTILRSGGPAEARIALIDVSTRQQKTLLQGGHAASYVSSGHLLYGSGGRLQAVAFDAQSLGTRGVPITVEGVATNETVGGFNANFDVSGNGTLAYLPPTAPELRTMAWVDREGRVEPIAAPPMEYIYPRISPDGTRVALDVGGRNRDIWMWHLDREVITRITEGPTEDLSPAWSLDGVRVFFASDREGGAFRVFSVAADGAGAERQEFAGADNYMPMSMPGPGELLVGVTGPGARGGDVAVVTLGQHGQARTLLGKEGLEGNSQVSPDGHWIAYQSLESGSMEVYVRPYPDVERRREQISRGGGVQPLWGKAGSAELFYWDLKGTLKVVSLTLTPNLSVGARRDIPLGDRYLAQGGTWVYDVSPRAVWPTARPRPRSDRPREPAAVRPAPLGPSGTPTRAACSSGIRPGCPCAHTPIQQDGRQSYTHAMISRDHFVQHRLSILRRPNIGIAALENQPERCAAVRLFGLVQVPMPGQWTPQHPEPARVVTRPVDPLERHAHDLGTAAAGAAPQDLFFDRA
jgi:hypothetical protein